MIREKAKELLTLLREGKGSATTFGSSYYDDEIQKIIQIITNECKSTIMKKDGTSKRYESDIVIHDVKDIIQQLLTDKNTIKNSLVSKLTRIPGRNIAGIMIPIKVDKKINEKGIPYIEVEKPLPDNISQIMNEEKFVKTIIEPYIAKICNKEPKLLKRYFFSRIFNPLNRREISNEELMSEIKNYLKNRLDLDKRRIQDISKYFTYNLLGNQSIIQEIIDDEVQGKSLQVIGEKSKFGYAGMIQNMSNNFLDIINSIPNPNDGLKEIEDIYANLTGQLEALSIEPEKNPITIEQQIKNINRNINRHRQAYYSEDGYRNVDVGFSGKDAGLLRKEYVMPAMHLYCEKIAKVLEQAEKMTEEQYIKEVAKLHFRFIQIHPFPDGNGRTARAISNMLLLEKNITAVFSKQNKAEYIRQMDRVRSVADKEYIEGLYTDQTICDKLEEERAYLLEEYIGIECLKKADLYKDRQITEELPKIPESR